MPVRGPQTAPSAALAAHPKTQAKKVEVVRVFENLGGQPGLRRGEPPVKVGDRDLLPQVQLVLDLEVQGVVWPGLFQGCAGIPVMQSRG